ncbi:caspase-6-like isoform X2 [Astyanax mexicanus]|uniref:caspase-6-like isoform X2 n=1 Tax=Astyanax mexicanus TaxID=7994 RepID=UPI0020CB5C4D|nr:caspase-6-like isoform X2 [Astyanax mexicanus]
MASREDSPAGSDQPEMYKMDHKRRGLALIFNQQDFSRELKNMGTRFGTAADKANLTERFKELRFEVKGYDDLKKKDMLQKIRKAAKDDHADADCFVCVFLSHGEDGHVYAFDDKIDIKEVTSLFRGDKCRSLVGKPKIFIFQACRGKDHEIGVTPMTADDSDTEVVEDAAMIYTLPAGADFLMCYSVAEGFVSFRHIEEGTYYIKNLCTTLQERGLTLEFTELLTLVNMKMSKWCVNGRKQMPCFSSMLTKSLYFKTKEQPA